MPSDLGAGYDEVTDALRLEGVSFLVMYEADAVTGPGGSRAATIGLLLPGAEVAFAGFARAYSRLKGSASGSAPSGIDHLRFSHGERPFVCRLVSPDDFTECESSSLAIHPGSPALLADARRVASFFAELDEGQQMVEEEVASFAAQQEREWEKHVLHLIQAQKEVNRLPGSGS